MDNRTVQCEFKPEEFWKFSLTFPKTSKKLMAFSNKISRIILDVTYEIDCNISSLDAVTRISFYLNDFNFLYIDGDYMEIEKSEFLKFNRDMKRRTFKEASQMISKLQNFSSYECIWSLEEIPEVEIKYVIDDENISNKMIFYKYIDQNDLMNNYDIYCAYEYSEQPDDKLTFF